MFYNYLEFDVDIIYQYDKLNKGVSIAHIANEY